MAKLFIAEDDPDILDTYRTVMEILDHEIVLEAATFEDALEKAPQAAGLGCTVAIIDGTLIRGTGGDHGQHVAKALREAHPSIFIISCSTEKKSWGDENLEKPFDVHELRALLAAH
ncbi:MAG: hypothetical protein Q8P12_03420 [bacterium]|nr:hypothetical protein [bacterium]